MIIYKTTNLINEKSYIGQDSKNSLQYLGSGILINEAIKKYRKENFQKETVAWCDTKEHLDFLERFYIDLFNTKVPNGYNLTEGGEGFSHGDLNPSKRPDVKKKKIGKCHGMLGKHHSNETKQLYSKQRKGKSKSEEHKKKIGDSHKGRHYHSEEWKEERRKIMKVRMSGENNPMKREEVREKISILQTGEKNSFFGKHHSKESIQKANESRKKTRERKQKESV